jgi:hypothetical protein
MGPCFRRDDNESGAFAAPQQPVIPRACGVSSTPRPIGSITNVTGILGRPVKPGDDSWDSNFKQPMTSGHTFAIPRHLFARVLLSTSRPLQAEGAGNAGRPVRPIAACAEIVVERTRVSQVTPESPGIPHAMVYGLCRALPGDRALLPPSPAELLPPT